MTTRIGCRRRGKSTLRPTYDKPNLAVEIRGEGEEDRDAGVLGMPADSDWILFAPFSYDGALLRNPLALDFFRETGHYSLRHRFCEVFISASGDAVNYSLNFAGVYTFMERVKRGDDRVDIARLSASDNDMPEVSGGYIFKTDDDLDGPTDVPFTAGGYQFLHVNPNADDITSEQKSWLIGYINDFAAALNGPDWKDPVNGYNQYIDRANFIDNHILHVFTVCVDWPQISAFWYKDRDGPLCQGPVYDFDRSMESKDGRDNAYNLWDNPYVYPFAIYFWNGLVEDPEFWQDWVDRWDELRLTVYSDSNIVDHVNGLAAQIEEAAPRHFERWDEYAASYSGGVHGTHPGTAPRNSWEWELDHLKEWLMLRAAWIDDQFPDRPLTDPPGGTVATGTLVTLSVPAGTDVYYTLDGSDPFDGDDGLPAAGAMLYSGAFQIVQDVVLTARAYTGEAWQGAPEHTPWSPRTRSYFITRPPSLTVTEVMYHPRPPSPAELGPGYNSSDFEFIELQHTGGEAASPLGVRFVDGVTFDFTDSWITTLQPAEHVLVVRCLDAFKLRYPNWASMRIAGEYGGNLNDGGERLELLTADESVSISFRYNDGRGWPQSADGLGHSLVPLSAAGATSGSLNYSGNWRASSLIDGSPGTGDTPPGAGVVINEVGAHTDTGLPPPYDSDDWIELYNPLSAPVDVGGWFLSDDGSDLDKWQIPEGTTIGQYDFLLLTEMNDFHTNRMDGSGFGLSKDGETVFLSHLPGNGSDRVVDSIRFKGQEGGVSVGRHADGAAYWYALSPTTNGINAEPQSHVLISEIMYHPAPTASHPENNLNDEYVELFNPLGTPVDLWTDAGPWRIDGASTSLFRPALPYLRAVGSCSCRSILQRMQIPWLHSRMPTCWMRRRPY